MASSRIYINDRFSDIKQTQNFSKSLVSSLISKQSVRFRFALKLVEKQPIKMIRLFAAICCTLFITQLTENVEGKLRKSPAPRTGVKIYRIPRLFSLSTAASLQQIANHGDRRNNFTQNSENKSLDACSLVANQFHVAPLCILNAN